MNLILLQTDDFIDLNIVLLKNRRFHYMINIHRIKLNDTVKVGKINGLIGEGCVISLEPLSVKLKVNLYQTPPKPMITTLVLALPRPLVLQRILEHVISIGVKRVILIHSARVEKSFWQTPKLKEFYLKNIIETALEQGVDTITPKIEMHKIFKPFIEDILPTLMTNKVALVAHPNVKQSCPFNLQKESIIIIGPEGGFVPYELDAFQNAGCQAIHLGERILKVETAVTSVLAKLY